MACSRRPRQPECRSASPTSLSSAIELPLRGAGDEPIDFARTLYSHGCAALAPATIVAQPLRLTTQLRIGRRIVRTSIVQRGDALQVATDAALASSARAELAKIVARMFALDLDLAPFYAMLADDASLAWARCGAGRLLASPSVFEDLVKTLCSTNCAFSATQRMVAALVALGGGAFPTPQIVVDAGVAYLTDTVRMGYRARSLYELATSTHEGAFAPESLRAAGGAQEEDVAARLGSLRGFGPYAVAHAMQLLGFHRPLILDSWTRPTYMRVIGKRKRSDAAIRRDFHRYGAYAGLAFWLTLTKDWVAD